MGDRLINFAGDTVAVVSVLSLQAMLALGGLQTIIGGIPILN